MSAGPPSEPRAGIGEWSVWGEEPPELWFRQSALAPAQAGATPRPLPAGEAVRDPSGLALAGFVLGLIGACLGWVPVLGLACGMFGAVLSMHARRMVPPGYRGRALPTAGLVLGCVGVVGGVLTSAVLATIGLNTLFGALYGG